MNLDHDKILEVHPLLGPIRPDPAANILGTGFVRFDAPRFEGLCRFTTPDTLDILAIVSKTPRCGHLGKFIKKLKGHFHTIRIYEIGNKHLFEALSVAHGFTPFTEYGVSGPNLQWEKPS